MEWRLKNTSSIIYNNSYAVTTANSNFVAGANCPTAVGGNVATTDQDSNTYLLNAIEVLFDFDGDDDGLCESNETCLYAPNFGAYQGEGQVSSCNFQNGTVIDVNMFGYDQNGI